MTTMPLLRRSLLLLCLLALALPAWARPQRTFPIAVRGAASDGWTDLAGGRDDSTADLVRALKSEHRTWLRYTPVEAEARIVLEVVERHMDDGYFFLTVRVTVGDHTTELQTNDNSVVGGWRNCAQKVVKKLEAWAEANRTRLEAGTTQATR